MIFGKRRRATAVVEAAGVASDPAQAKAVVGLLVVAAKKAQRMVRGAGPRGDMDDLDLVVMAARAAPHDLAAAAKAEKALGLGAGHGSAVLAKIAAAATSLYQAEGRDLGAPRPGDRMRDPFVPPAR